MKGRTKKVLGGMECLLVFSHQWKILCPRRPLQKTVGFKSHMVKLPSSVPLFQTQLL